MSGILYLVSTPIGNLRDISQRAVDVLKEVDIIACEDTRHTGKLLKHLDIKNQLLSYHEHNEKDRIKNVLKLLNEGKSVALVSDAGTPVISDPGYGLVTAAREAGFEATAIPGPTAFVAACLLSGLPTDAIYFGGFLPSKTGARKKALRAVKDLKATLVFYESPRRIASSLNDCAETLGARKGAVVREITKIHEETITGDLNELAQITRDRSIKGEIVLLIDRNAPRTKIGGDDSESRLIELLEKYRAEGIERKAALKRAAKECGYSKPEAYRIVESMKE